MYRPRQTGKADRRQAVILMVVVILLTLFAVIGIAFVFYSSSEATSSRIFREAQSINDVQADLSPDLLLRYFLGQLIYDVDDNLGGAASSMRGNSLGRNMFGWDYDATSAANPNASFNAHPFSGVGRLHYTFPPTAPGGLAGQDSYDLVNYTYYYNPTNPALSDGYVLDPERPGQPRTDVGTTLAPTLPQSIPYVGANAPYTYPDKNNMYLAAVAADGTVLEPSFYRPNSVFTQFYNPGAPAPWTTAGLAKHYILRPRPAENPTFPLPVSPGGDVKNLTGSPGTLIGGQLFNEDSFWMDLGFPVQQLPGGGFYKPLFAPLVMELDNRVNLNAAGNLRASSRDASGNMIAPYGHGSNQGWGRWEVNPGQVLGANPTEWFNLLVGNNTLSGRYGKITAASPTTPQPLGPNGLTAAASGDTPTFYGQGDYDGGNEKSPGGKSQPFMLPQPGSFSPFPTFGAGWGNGFPPERTFHPSLYDYFAPVAPNTAFDVSNMQGLLVNMGQQASSNVLGQLCPTNFGNPTDPATIRRRNLVTTTSFDFDRPAIVPWVWNPNDPSTAYAYPDPANPTALYPGGNPIPFPTTSGVTPGTAPPVGSEFGADWRAIESALGRLDLDVTLPDYPTLPNPLPAAGYDMSTDPKYAPAVQARQMLALQIFQRLVYATGAVNPATTAVAPSPQQFDALRWLAQLSANIVDYVDNDDYMTPFPWATLASANNPNPAFITAVPGLDPVGNGWVYGTELPRVVINEVYSQIDNDPTNKTGPTNYINFWVELLNPFSADPVADEGGNARLEIPGGGGVAGGGTAVYRLYIAQDPLAPGNPAQLGIDIRAANNVRGDIPTADSAQVKGTLQNWTPAQIVNGFDTNVILPNNGAYTGVDGKNQGFYVLGPDSTETPTPFPGTAAGTPPTPTNQNHSMSYPILAAAAPAFGSAATWKHMLVLQRLANPYVKFDPIQNPYITVDYVDQIPLQEGRTYAAGQARVPPLGTNHSYGKRQPFASNATQIVQQAPQGAPNTQPQTTFFRHNAIEPANPSPSTPNQTLQMPFDWLVQPDRQLVSPMELLQVSGFKPHELTQTFVQIPQGGTTPVPHQHIAPWFDETSRIYRVLELLECHDRFSGIGVGGRQVGKININTIWDPETFYALCDAPAAVGTGPNYFAQPDVQALYNQLISQRTPGTSASPSGTTYHVPNAGGATPDAPFWPFGAPNTAGAAGSQYAANMGINSTLLRSAVPGGAFNTPRLLQPTRLATNGMPPVVLNELLTKIANNVTTRSNVFAVWVTVGFFQVTDPTTSPPTLGPEIGLSQNRNIRHQMFAIIDRTNLTLAPTVTQSNTPVVIPLQQPSVTKTITVTALSGTISTNNAAGGKLNAVPSNGTITWQIQPGMSLVVDQGTSQEVVQVQAAANNQITATFLRPHSGTYSITIPGNPGPQPMFDQHSPIYAPVVPYFAILQ